MWVATNIHLDQLDKQVLTIPLQVNNLPYQVNVEMNIIIVIIASSSLDPHQLHELLLPKTLVRKPPRLSNKYK